MPRALLRRGLRFVLNGEDYVTEKLEPNGELSVRMVSTGGMLQISQTQIMEALLDGKLKFDVENKASRYRVQRRTPDVESLDLLDDTEENRKRKAEIKRRLKYVTPAVRRPSVCFTKEALQPIIDQIGKSINDPKPPSFYTLARWSKFYISHGENPLVLEPLTRKRGNRTAKFGFDKDYAESICAIKDDSLKAATLKACRSKAEQVRDIFLEEYEAFFLLREQPTVKALYDRIDSRIRRINKTLSECDQLPIPVPSSIYARVEKQASRETDEFRLGKRESDKIHMTSGQGPRPSFPLDLTQMDATRLPFMVLDTELSLPIGRPEMFSLRDVFTGMPLGWCADYNAPAYLGVMTCLLHSIMPKTYVKTLYPEIQNESPCCGIPGTIVLDNASYFVGESLEDASVELGFALDFAPAFMPWYKSHIENFWRIIYCELLSFIPGKAFSRLFKGDYDPKEHALISDETFRKLLHIYFIDIFPCEVHKFDGFLDVPLRRWQEAVGTFPPVLPAKCEDLRVLIGEVLHRHAISNNGIEIDGLFYNSDQLQEFRDRWYRKKKEGDTVKIKRDRHKISTCYVKDFERGAYIQVPAKNQNYTLNLTKYQHDVIRRRARIIAKDFVDPDALSEAKALVQRTVQQEWERAQPGDTRVRLARYKDYGYPVSHEGIENKEDHDPTESSEGETGSDRLYAEAKSSQGTANIGNAIPTLEVNGNCADTNAQFLGSLMDQQSQKALGSKSKIKRESAGPDRRPPPTQFDVNPMDENDESYGDESEEGSDDSTDNGWSVDYD